MDVGIIALILASITFLVVLTFFVPKRRAVYLNGQRMREGENQDYVWEGEGLIGWRNAGIPKMQFRMKPRDVIIVEWQIGPRLHEDVIDVQHAKDVELYGASKKAKVVDLPKPKATGTDDPYANH